MARDVEGRCSLSLEIGYNENDHQHVNQNNEQATERYGLPDDVKAKVKELERLNVKPNAIMEKLRQLGMIYKTDQIKNQYAVSPKPEFRIFTCLCKRN
jgi:hypothetical protein